MWTREQVAALFTGLLVEWDDMRAARVGGRASAALGAPLAYQSARTLITMPRPDSHSRASAQRISPSSTGGMARAMLPGRACLPFPVRLQSGGAVARPSVHAARLSALRTLDAPSWRAHILAAIRAAGSVIGAARQLGVSHRSLCRWVASDAVLRAELDLQRATFSSL